MAKLIHHKLIENMDNLEIVAVPLQFTASYFVNKILWYPFIYKDYLYYREDSNILPHPEHELIKRFKFKSIYSFEHDDNYSLQIGIASHNFKLFEINNKTYGIGGQAVGSRVYKDCLKTTNTKYINYHSSEINKEGFINSNDFNVNPDSSGCQLYNPKKQCPYYANGLHLFLFDNVCNNVYSVENNGLPIISGIHPGRHDGHYGYCDNINIEKSKDGLAVFDSTTNILYNERDNKYYLYQRANIGLDARYIQYSTSSDLVNWSEFNLLKIDKSYNHFENNIYCGNFFKIPGVNNYICILPISYKNSNVYTDIKKSETFNLYYSDDCVNWNYVGISNIHEYYKLWAVNSEPILYENKYIFYFSNHKKKTIDTYSISLNRFSCVKTIEKDVVSTITIKLMKFDSKKITLNLKTHENGYIKVQLKDENNQILEGFSFSDFDTIQQNVDVFFYTLTWKTSETVPEEQIFIEIIGTNFNIYAIN